MMKITKGGYMTTPQVENDPLVTLDQAEDISILFGAVLGVLQNNGVTVPIEEVQSVIERSLYYSENPATGMETLKAALRLARSASKSEELDEWLEKILIKLDDDRLNLWEGVSSGISLPKAISSEQEAQR